MMNRARALIAATLLLGCWAGACSQAQPAEDAGEGADDYSPLVDGASWTYLHSSKGGWQETVTVKEVEHDGSPAFMLTDTPNPDGTSTESILVNDGTSLLRVYKEQFLDGAPELSVVYDPGFLRFDSSWLEESVPFSDSRAYQRTETDVGQSPQATTDREHVFTVESLSESVQTEGQTFRNCIRFRRTRKVVADAGTTPLTQSDQEKLYWFAPGVGKVREVNLTTGNTEVLVDYEIPR